MERARRGRLVPTNARKVGVHEAHAALISPQGAAVEVRAIKADEEAMIARHKLALVGDALIPNAP